MSTLNNMMIVTTVSAVSCLITNLAAKLILHPEKMREKIEALKEFRTQRAAALRLKDQKLLKKLDKQKLYMSQLEKEVSSFQLRMAILNMLPLASFIILGFFVSLGELAGYFPATIAHGGETIPVPLVAWYSICIFFFTLLFRKLLKTGV
ncbi:MAG: EMC3/TMCO1 family protein [Thermoproteota archaeon]